MATNQDIAIACSRCKKSSPIKSMKYDKDGKNLICPECYDYRYNPTEAKKEAKKMKYVAEEDPYFEKKIKYKCQKCKMGFMIKRRPDLKKRCPYCGGEQIVEQDTELSVNELIREASKKEYDF